MSDSPYLRGDGAASLYIGMKDPQGRTFRKWAEARGVPFTLIGNQRTYRKADIDKVWERESEGSFGPLTEAVAQDTVARR